MSPKRPEFADCLASPSPRTRGLAMPILGFLLCGQLTGCFLIPTVETECTIDKPCPTGQHCSDSGWCELDPGVSPPDMTPYCVSNRDCKESKVCVYDSADRSKNYCLDSNKLLYVDPPNCTNNTPDGTIGKPYCDINTAIQKLATGQALRLLAESDYGIIDSANFGGRQVTIYGPYEPIPGIDPMQLTTRPTLSGGPAVRISGQGAHLTLDSVVISANRGNHAVECFAGGKLFMRRSVVALAKEWGIYADSCSEVTIDRSQVLANAGGFYANAVRRFSVENSLFAKNNSSLINPASALYVIGPYSGIFRFNTIAENVAKAKSAGAILGAASNPNQSIIASIIVGNTLTDAPAQYYPPNNFQLQEVVIGSAVQYIPPGPENYSISNLEPVFSNAVGNDYSLIEDASTNGPNSQCCLKKIAKPMDVGIDLYGQQRGALTEPGAFARPDRRGYQ